MQQERNRKSILSGMFLGLALIGSGGSLQAATIRVPADQPTIQAGIDAADNGGTVLVNSGTYWEKINFQGKLITVRSVNGADKTIIYGSGSGSIVTFNKLEGPNSVLDGFTIKNGSTNGSGGGIYCNFSWPTITNCTITSNRAYWYGGGIYCESAGPTITNCTVASNKSSYIGGGIYGKKNSSFTIDNCTIRGNETANSGGGIYADADSALTAANCIISGNKSGWYGGGISASQSTILNCTIGGNVAVYGGGVSSGGGNTIQKCTIRGNRATVAGGGICFENASPGAVTNCIINGNSAASAGGGIYCSWSSPKITNCTLGGNTSPHGGGIYAGLNAAPSVLNSILWGDTVNELERHDTGSFSIDYSDIQGGWPTGTGNINTNPKFVGGGNYHLTSTSPCIDAATAAGSPADDIDGSPRPQVAGYDMGADEFVVNKPPVIDITLNKNSFTTGQTIIAIVHITNDGTPDDVTLKVVLDMPDGIRMALLDMARYNVPANADVTLPPITYTSNGSEAAGNYQVGGRLLETKFGDHLSTDIKPFSFNP